MSKTDTSTAQARPTTDTTIRGWVGIVNGVGQLSEIAASRGMAEMTLGNRGDKDECRLVPVTVIADLTGKPRCVDAGGKFSALPASIRDGIAALLAAVEPNAQPMSDDDRRLRLDAYAEAVDGFPVTVANEALKLLFLRNPHNPGPPTPEAVREVCEIVWRHEEGNRS